MRTVAAVCVMDAAFTATDQLQGVGQIGALGSRDDRVARCKLLRGAFVLPGKEQRGVINQQLGSASQAGLT